MASQSLTGPLILYTNCFSFQQTHAREKEKEQSPCVTSTDEYTGKTYSDARQIHTADYLKDYSLSQ